MFWLKKKIVDIFYGNSDGDTKEKEVSNESEKELPQEEVKRQQSGSMKVNQGSPIEREEEERGTSCKKSTKIMIVVLFIVIFFFFIIILPLLRAKIVRDSFHVYDRRNTNPDKNRLNITKNHKHSQKTLNVNQHAKTSTRRSVYDNSVVIRSSTSGTGGQKFSNAQCVQVSNGDMVCSLEGPGIKDTTYGIHRNVFDENMQRKLPEVKVSGNTKLANAMTSYGHKLVVCNNNGNDTVYAFFTASDPNDQQRTDAFFTILYPVIGNVTILNHKLSSSQYFSNVIAFNNSSMMFVGYQTGSYTPPSIAGNLNKQIIFCNGTLSGNESPFSNTTMNFEEELSLDSSEDGVSASFTQNNQVVTRNFNINGEDVMGDVIGASCHKSGTVNSNSVVKNSGNGKSTLVSFENRDGTVNIVRVSSVGKNNTLEQRCVQALNTSTNQKNINMEKLENGDIVIGFETEYPDSSVYDVAFRFENGEWNQIFSSRVNEDATCYSGYPTVKDLGKGRFAFIFDRQCLDTSTYYKFRVQIKGYNGGNVGSQYEINCQMLNSGGVDFTRPSVTTLKNGGFGLTMTCNNPNGDEVRFWPSCPVVENDDLNLNAKETKQITTNNLSAQSPWNAPPNSLFFKVKSSANMQVFKQETNSSVALPVLPGGNFTQQDLLDGRVSFMSENFNHPNLELSLFDGNCETQSFRLNIGFGFGNYILIPIGTGVVILSAITLDILCIVGMSFFDELRNFLFCVKQKQKSNDNVGELTSIAPGTQKIERDDLQFIKKIGSGAFGTVFVCKWCGEEVACKKFDIQLMVKDKISDVLENDTDISKFCREVEFLKTLNCPQVVRLYGIYSFLRTGSIELGIVMEYASKGSLDGAVSKGIVAQWSPYQKWIVIHDLAIALYIAHKAGIFHRDVKPANVLLVAENGEIHVKLADFGCSRLKDKSKTDDHVGTYAFMAPELVTEATIEYSEKCDTYGFAMTACVVIKGEALFPGMLDSSIPYKASDGSLPEIDFPSNFPEHVIGIIKEGRDSVRERRPTMESVVTNLEESKCLFFDGSKNKGKEELETPKERVVIEDVEDETSSDYHKFGSKKD